MARHEKQPPVRRLLTQLAALKSRIALLQTAQAEFRSLVDDIEAQLERPGLPRGVVRRLLDDIRAIDMCVHFELNVPLQDASTQPSETSSDCQPRHRLGLHATPKPHGRPLKPRTNASARDR